MEAPVTEDALYSLGTQVALLALAIVAVVATAKQVVRATAGPQALDSKVAQVLLRIAPVMLGAMGGMVDGFFDGYAPGPRAMLGVVAGFASPTIYKLVADRLPTLLGSKDAPWRGGRRAGPGGDAPE